MTEQPDAERAIRTFLAAHDLADATRTPMSGDASTRAYERITSGDGSWILAKSGSAARDGVICPIGANGEERRVLGYDALARRSCSRVDAFVCVADWLHAQGIPTPGIVAADLDAQLLLQEDLGDATLFAALAPDQDDPHRYRQAINLLVRMRGRAPTAALRAGNAGWVVQSYDDVALQAEADLFLDYYAPPKGRTPSDGDRAAWRAAWQDGCDRFASNPSTLVLRDYHSPNIMLVDDGIAIIDFQDALIGSPTYDLASLLQDPRRTIGPDFEREMIDHYLSQAGIGGEDSAAFLSEYHFFGLQRVTKLLGGFHRLALQGKPTYLQYIDFVESLLSRNLDYLGRAGRLPELVRIIEKLRG